MNKSKKSTLIKIAGSILIVIGAAGGFITYWAYEQIFAPNVHDNNEQPFIFFIPTGSNADSVKNLLVKNKIIINLNSFSLSAKLMKYEQHVLPGRYIIAPSMSNRSLIQLLRSGKQTPLELVINNIRTKEDLVSLVSSKLELDSAALLEKLNDKIFLQQYGLTPENCIVAFIPNTYEFYWTTDEIKFINRMMKENKKFWNDSRMEKAKNINLNTIEVITLASIVEQETIKEEEKKIIAGVYLNRLKRGWKLQADPTVKFALKQFDLQRVLNEHLTYDSPYNTYLYDGLPPGPICLPETKTIDAVLNYEQHDYMYFCAKDDFSGYHNFAITLKEHLMNASKFQNFLNRNKIFR